MCNKLTEALRKHAKREDVPAFPYDDLAFTLQEAATEIERLRAEVEELRNDLYTRGAEAAANS